MVGQCQGGGLRQFQPSPVGAGQSKECQPVANSQQLHFSDHFNSVQTEQASEGESSIPCEEKSDVRKKKTAL